MLSGYNWDEYQLFVSIRNRFGTYGYLLNFVSQDEFMDHYVEKWVSEGSVAPLIDMSAVHLTSESFEKLEPHWNEVYKLGV